MATSERRQQELMAAHADVPVLPAGSGRDAICFVRSVRQIDHDSNRKTSYYRELASARPAGVAPWFDTSWRLPRCSPWRAAALAAEPLEIKIGYLRRAEAKTAISLLDVPPDNDGVAGAQLAIADNNTTGRFLNQRFRLEDVRLKEARTIPPPP